MPSVGEVQSMAANIFSAYASMAASAMLFRSISKDMLPQPVKAFLFAIFGRFFKYLMSKFFSNIPNRMTMVVDEQSGFTRNQIYDAAEVYLGTKIDLNSERLKVNKGPKQKAISLSMEKGQEVIDWYNDSLKLQWKFHLVEPEPERGRGKDKRHFELTFDRNSRETVLNEYLPFVLAKAKEIRENERGIKLFTRDCPFQDDDNGMKGGGRGGGWGCINLDHPITFDKLAMDKKLKCTIMEDLDMFVRRKDYYKKVGKAWKRGYLLYGPPGTGKSSLVAAMANRLQFDVYDLQLSSVRTDSDLRRILFSTNNKSIIVVEDIDCSSPTHQRPSSDHDDKRTPNSTNNNELTLSGLLNFIDGLWSSCGDERIIIFTTNHKEKLDPALLRPGRMDMHIHMGYCTPEGFDVLALNYFGLHDHPVFFPKIKELIEQVKITPAELAEHMLRNEKAEIALEGLIDLLKQKKEEQAHKEMQEQDKEMQRSESGKNSDVHAFGNGKGDESVKASMTKSSSKSGRFGKILTSFRKSKMQS